MKTNKITRFEIIDHTPCVECEGTGIEYLDGKECDMCGGLGMPGRAVIMYDENKQIDIEVQDNGRTLKVFIHERYE